MKRISNVLAGLPSKPITKMSAGKWRREAQEGRSVDLETALAPGGKSRFPGPPSTSTQVTLVEIMSSNTHTRNKSG